MILQRGALTLLGGSLFLVVCACERKQSGTVTTPTPTPRPTAWVLADSYDACTLLTREEVETVQGSAVTETKTSDKADVFRSSQCYYMTVDPNRSVSLVLTRNLGPGQRSPKEFWKETFGRYDNEAGEKEEIEEKGHRRDGGEEREREKAAPPKKIEDLGESAYWTGDRIGGALYVLKGDAYIRISVGGRDSDEGKIEKTTALAQKVLPRF